MLEWVIAAVVLYAGLGGILCAGIEAHDRRLRAEGKMSPLYTPPTFSEIWRIAVAWPFAILVLLCPGDE